MMMYRILLNLLVTFQFLPDGYKSAILNMLTVGPSHFSQNCLGDPKSLQNCLEAVSFSMTSTGGGFYYYTGRAGQGYCHPILPDMPTTVTIKDVGRGGCKYNVIRYYGGVCLDDAKMNEMGPLSLVAPQTVTLNKRQPVCSYKLENLPDEHCVTIKFYGGNTNESQTICNADISMQTCFNLCGPTCENIYPSRIKITKNDAVDTRIGVSLYSQFSCADGTQLVNANNGNKRIYGAQSLNEWTHENPNSLVASFLLEYQVGGSSSL